jgi:hypothetical protein
MDTSIFPNKEEKPNNENLKSALGKTFELWLKLRDIVFEKYPDATEEWNFPGKKYGWSFRIKDKKRAIIYLLPREDYFKVAFVFGQKATDLIMGSNIDISIREELKNAKKYAEGRGIRIEVRNNNIIPDIENMIDIKLAN